MGLRGGMVGQFAAEGCFSQRGSVQGGTLGGVKAQASVMRVGSEGRRLTVSPPVTPAVTLWGGPNHSPPSSSLKPLGRSPGASL
eukprot:1133472-Pyramimonas_sp.AAC.1